MRKPKPKVGCYVRCSTTDQTTASQRLVIRDWAKTHHVNSSHIRWYEDKRSGKNTDRQELQKLLHAVDLGRVDTVVVHDLSRLARNTQDGLRILADLCNKGVRVVSVTENIDFGSSAGQLIATVLLAVATFDRATRNEKIKAGLQAAREAGKQLGRPRNEKRLQAIKRMRDKGLGVAEIAERLKCSRQNVYKALDRLQDAA